MDWDIFVQFPEENEDFLELFDIINFEICFLFEYFPRPLAHHKESFYFGLFQGLQYFNTIADS